MKFKNWYETFEAPTNPGKIIWYNDYTDEIINGPICGENLVARFDLGQDSYWIRFEEIESNSISISFGTKRRGVFMTKAGTPFTALSQVFGVVGQFLQSCPRIRFTFTSYSDARNRVFTRLIARFFPHYVQDSEGFYVLHQ